jgi:UDP-glucuronate decarboxylase
MGIMNNKIIQEDIDFIFNSDLDWDRFRNKTVLISGASGFIASYMVETLLYLNEKLNQQSTKVIALVRNIDKAKVRFNAYLQCPEFKLLLQDVSDEININDEVDYIIHAASQASPKYYSVDPVGTLKANIFGTTNLLSLAKKLNTKSFLFFSSSEVYGEIPEELNPIAENDFGYLNPTSVRSCYAESKRMGENICISWAHQYGLDVKIVRPFHTYGPMMELNDGRVFADFTADMLCSRNIVMKSDGSSKRAYCYLADAIIAYFLVLLKGVSGEAYNVGNPECECSVLDLANRLINIFPQKKLTVITREQDNLNYLASKTNRVTPDITKIKSLGWLPKYTIEEGFERTVYSYAF